MRVWCVVSHGVFLERNSARTKQGASNKEAGAWTLCAPQRHASRVGSRAYPSARWSNVCDRPLRAGRPESERDSESQSGWLKV